jgi:hypothetical protein
MVRQRQYGVANIVAHPHPPGVYRKIFSTASEIAEGTPFYGDYFARLSHPTVSEEGVFRGHLAIWTEVDQAEPIIFKESLKQNLIQDTDITIPDNIGFNSKLFYFSFREIDHTFFVELQNDEGHTTSIGRVIDALDAIFKSIDLPDLDHIDVYVKSQKDAVSRVLDLKMIRKIQIVINLPNPDDLQEGISRIYEELHKIGAKKLATEITKDRGQETLNLTLQYLAQAEIAKDNGFVESEGVNEVGEKVKLSTKDHPKIITLPFEEDDSGYRKIVEVARGIMDG